MATQRIERVKLDFYALGKAENIPQPNFIAANKGLSDKAGNILERNNLSLNSKNLENYRNNIKTFHSVNEMNKESNNYLNPTNAFESRDKYGIKPNFTNRETLNITRLKYHSKDAQVAYLNKGSSVSKTEFLNKKSEENNYKLPQVTTEKIAKLNDNNLYFDKNNKEMIRYPKGFWGTGKEYYSLIC